MQSEKYNPVLLKFELMTAGVRLDEEVKKEVGKTIKGPSFTKAGAGTSGIDLILEKDVMVSALTYTKGVEKSPFVLTKEENGYVIFKGEKKIQNVNVFPVPKYYDKKTSDGVPMSKVGQVTGDFVGFALNNNCLYWVEGKPCIYCSIGANVERGFEEAIKSPKNIAEVLNEALKEPHCKHAHINSGTFARPDRGAKLYCEVIQAVKKTRDVWMRAVLVPPELPEGKQFIDMLYDAGLDTIGFYLEAFNEDRRKIACPAKAKDVQRETYFKALEYAVKKFGPGRVYSTMVEGIEKTEDSAAGAEFLASMGVTPTIHIFRPVPGAKMQNWPTTPLQNIVWLYRRMKESLDKYRVDAACAGCNRRRVNTKIFEGRVPGMPEISEKEFPDLDPLPIPLPE